MTWAEYQVRRQGYLRMEAARVKEKLTFYRRSWYNTLIGPHLDPKKLPKTEKAYMDIEEPKEGRTLKESHRNKFLEAMKRYERIKAEKENGSPTT